MSRFPPLLRELDSDKASLRVHSYGLSVTTMEEVFLNVARAAVTAAALRRQENGEKAAQGQVRPSPGNPSWQLGRPAWNCNAISAVLWTLASELDLYNRNIRSKLHN